MTEMSSSDEFEALVKSKSITPVVETSVDENSQKLVKRGKNKAMMMPLDEFVQPVAPGQNVCIFRDRNGQKNCKTLVRVAGQVCDHHQKLITPKQSEVAQSNVKKSEGVIRCRYNAYPGKKCTTIVSTKGGMCGYHREKVSQYKMGKQSKSSWSTVMFFMMALVVVACAGFVIGRQK